MTEQVQGRQRKRRPLWLAVAVLVFLLVVAIVPPLVSINGYKSRIIQLMSESLGRPVRLSSVELRLLPAPAFVLTDLTVDEDPAYGAEPVLHANTVKASIRLLSLWRGRLEIGTIGVDEASLNVVRTAEGRWNLDPLFRTAAKTQPADVSVVQGRKKRVVPLPYLEATNSRINFKNGAEKLPFSLVETDLSFWQEEPGDWRIRLRGQPARTDVNLDLADTGLVRLEARVQSASELRRLPIHLDMEWREAQLGQLTRLLIGSDAGWRGDLTWTAPPTRPRSGRDCALPGFTAPSLLRRRQWTSMPVADFCITLPRGRLSTWPVILRLATAGFTSPGICPETQGCRVFPWSSTGFRWLRVWMRCARFAAILARGLRLPAQSAARSAMPGLLPKPPRLKSRRWKSRFGANAPPMHERQRCVHLRQDH